MGLASMYEDYFRIGAACAPDRLDQQGVHIAKHYRSITAENCMKPIEIQPAEGLFDFRQADKLVNYAFEHQLEVRGHTLVWHNQTGEWMFKDGNNHVTKETLFARMKTHIATVMARYPLIKSWDVLNEAIADEDNRFLRESMYSRIAGESYIEHAFKCAHEANHNANLFYNDYNESDPKKRDKIVRLLKGLLEKGIPVHGIGMQGHWNLYGPSIEEVQAAIEAYASLGLRIEVTELDLSLFDWNDRRCDLLEPTSEMLELQAKRYDEIFSLFRSYKDVIDSVTFWGAADDYTWLSDFPVKGRKNWPFLFDDRYQPKESYKRVTHFSRLERV